MSDGWRIQGKIGRYEHDSKDLNPQGQGMLGGARESRGMFIMGATFAIFTATHYSNLGFSY